MEPLVNPYHSLIYHIWKYQYCFATDVKTHRVPHTHMCRIQVKIQGSALCGLSFLPLHHPHSFTCVWNTCSLHFFLYFLWSNFLLNSGLLLVAIQLVSAPPLLLRLKNCCFPLTKFVSSNKRRREILKKEALKVYWPRAPSGWELKHASPRPWEFWIQMG